MSERYEVFLERKSQIGNNAGFEPVWMPDFLFGFQAALDEWAIRRGRAAIFAGCGLGKTPMQLVWAENVVRHTNGRVLIVTTLGDSTQTVREGEKFGVECVRSKDGKFPATAKIIVTNYERLHHFDPSDFIGVVCNESSILKNADGKTRAIVTEFLRTIPYRLLCTATPAPNDYDELGTSSEALGEMGFADMRTMFFKQQTSKDRLGWGRTKYRLRPYAERDLWRWVCSWARAIRRPSDLGFEDGPFALPELIFEEHTVQARTLRPGTLFSMPAITMQEQREERRRTLTERCEKVVELVSDTGKPALVWCGLNDEGDLLERLIADSKQVKGSQSDDEKEEFLNAFSLGQIRVLVTKPIIAAWGMNWQHCAHETFFPSHSYEQMHQAIARCWRFGQMVNVKVDIVSSEGEAGVLESVRRKADAAEVMLSRLVELMGDQLKIERSSQFPNQVEAPSWL